MSSKNRIFLDFFKNSELTREIRCHSDRICPNLHQCYQWYSPPPPPPFELCFVSSHFASVWEFSNMLLLNFGMFAISDCPFIQLSVCYSSSGWMDVYSSSELVMGLSIAVIKMADGRRHGKIGSWYWEQSVITIVTDTDCDADEYQSLWAELHLAWYQQGTNHYLNIFLSRSMTPCSITQPQ